MKFEIPYEDRNSFSYLNHTDLELTESEFQALSTHGPYNSSERNLQYWQRIIEEAGNAEQKNAHSYYRQDRKQVRFCSYEVWNEFGSQDADSIIEPSAEEHYLHDSEQKDSELYLKQILQSLTPKQLEVLLLCKVRGVSQTAAAQKLGISAVAVHKRLISAIAACQQAASQFGLIYDSDTHTLKRDC